MHDMPGRIDVVIIVAAVRPSRAWLIGKTYKRCGNEIAHLLRLPEAALFHRRPNCR